MSGDDIAWMARALQLAERGLYTTDPNPRVGCVIVREGRAVGEGWHRRAGEPHAERVALEAAGEAARGATAYITLEPCCHFGRTPPCSEALLAAGVRRVVAAMRDPNPLVAGEGLARLEAAGVEVSSGVLEGPARALNSGFVRRMETARPLVRCKLAMSLDGRTAMASGESRWITSEEARRDVQRLRARSSAILTGVQTVLADDPSLNVRLPVAELLGVEDAAYLRQPLRVVMDSRLRTPAAARLLALPGPTLMFCGAEAAPARQIELEAVGAEVIRSSLAIPDPHQVVAELARRDVNELLVEAGPTLAGTLLSANLIDELWLYMAPHVMGDAARGLFHLPGLERMSDRLALRIQDVRQVGCDLRIVALPNRL